MNRNPCRDLRPELVIAGRDDGTAVVVSTHKKFDRATKEAFRLARKHRGVRFAAVTYTLNCRDKDQAEIGDTVNFERVFWPRGKDRGCSECCDNCRPDGLNYRCPILKGNPWCERVAGAMFFYPFVPYWPFRALGKTANPTFDRLNPGWQDKMRTEDIERLLRDTFDQCSDFVKQPEGKTLEEKKEPRLVPLGDTGLAFLVGFQIGKSVADLASLEKIDLPE